MPATAPPLDYAPANPRRSWRRTLRILTALGVLSLIGYVVAAFFPAYSRLSICATCGEIVTMNEYRLPFTAVAIYHTYSHKPTAVSRVIAKHAISPKHSDQLVFIGGGGRSLFSAMCELGGHRMRLSTVEDDFIARFLDNVLTYTDQATGQTWIDRTLATDSKFELDLALDQAQFPEAGFTTATAFDGWWKLHQAELDQAAK